MKETLDKNSSYKSEKYIAGWDSMSVSDKMYWKLRYKDSFTDLTFKEWFLESSTPTAVVKLDELTSNETVSGQCRYAGKVETIEYIEQMVKAWADNGIKPDVAWNLGQVLRYLSSRLGRKDDINIELGKAKNYLNRAMTGEWEVK